MASAPALDLESLLQPIAGESPTGLDPREDSSGISPYYTVKDGRKAARDDERQGLFGGVIAGQEIEKWRPVTQSGTTLLKDLAKDLEIAAFITEALTRTHSFGGLRDGFDLMRGLVENFWDGLHPMPDEYGMETRVAPLEGLNGPVLQSPIARIPITQGSDKGPFATWNVDQALELDRMDAASKKSRIESGATQMEDIRQAAAQTKPEFFIQLMEDITGALESWKGLSDALQEKAGADAPGTTAVREALEATQARLRFIAGAVLADSEPVPDEQTAESGDDSGSGAAAPSAKAGGPIGDREQAFKALDQAADFFRRTEPHSPIPFLLDRAVRYGRMPLTELLAELIPDAGARTTFNALTGVEPKEPEA